MHNEIFLRYNKNDKSALIPLLQEVQDVYGYLPEDAINEVAEFVGSSVARIYGVATFYNMFRMTPLGANVIKVCRGTACHVKNSANLLFALEDTLKIKAGQTTRDKKFTLELVNCIGACSIAPVITVNEEYYGRIGVKDIPSIIKKYQGKPKVESKDEAANQKQEVVL